MNKEQLVDALLEACDREGKLRVERDPGGVPENQEDYVLEPEYTNGQVDFLADVVLDVLYGFGWTMDGPEASGRWALFGEDFSPVFYHEGRKYPHHEGAYRMDLRGGVPSFWRILCQAAVRRGWIDQSAAPEL